MDNFKIFISHHHEEKLLARSWQRLVSLLTQGAVVPWYSSDERAAGGVTPGEWHPQIRKEIEDATVILVLITPVSNEKPWLFFESGLASGQRKTIIPIYYYMRQDTLNSVFRNLQCYNGDRLEGIDGIRALATRLISRIPWPGSARGGQAGVGAILPGVPRSRQDRADQLLLAHALPRPLPRCTCGGHDGGPMVREVDRASEGGWRKRVRSGFPVHLDN